MDIGAGVILQDTDRFLCFVCSICLSISPSGRGNTLFGSFCLVYCKLVDSEQKLVKQIFFLQILKLSGASLQKNLIEFSAKFIVTMIF